MNKLEMLSTHLLAAVTIVTEFGESDQFKNRFPPLHGLIPLIIGLIAQSWGFLNMRMGRFLPKSAFVFVAGIILIAYGFYVVLPWLADLR